MTSVVHPIPPVFDAASRVLILGTMPSPKSRQARFYYAHPQNRFWPVLAALYGAELPSGSDARRLFALSHGIALWDVLQSCAINGASDASIRNAVPNDLSIILDHAPVRAVFTTGVKAFELYNKFCFRKMTDIPAIPLPSSSSANRRISDAALLEAYSQIKKYTDLL